MKTHFIVETKDGKWRVYKNRKVGDGMVSLGQSMYQPDPTKARFREYHSWIPPFRRITVRTFLFRQGDPESMPLFRELAEKDGNGNLLFHPIPYVRMSGYAIERWARSNRARKLMYQELNWWVIISVGLLLLTFILGAAIYAEHAH